MRRPLNIRSHMHSLLLASTPFLLLSLLLAAHPATAAGDTANSWLEGWHYRRPILVKSGVTLEDYQLRVTIDTKSLVAEGKLRSDCGDLRFTLDDGVTEIPYWVERGCGTRETVVWLRVPKLSAGEVTTLYIYYGNPAASSLSDPGKVFLFYDDFDTDSGWLASYARYRITRYDGYTVMEVVDTDSARNNIVYRKLGVPCNVVVEWRAVQPEHWKFDQFGVALFDGKLIDESTGRIYNGYFAGVDYDGEKSSAYIMVDHNAEHSLLAKYSDGVSIDKWHVYSFAVTCNGYLEFWSDEGWMTSAKDDSYKSFEFLGLWLDTESTRYGVERPVYYDWIRVRRYTLGELAAVIGGEEGFSGPAASTVTVTVTRRQAVTTTATLTVTKTRTVVSVTTRTLASSVPVTRTVTRTVTRSVTTTATATATRTERVTVTSTLFSTVARTLTVERPTVSTVTATVTDTVTVAAKPSPAALGLALAAIAAGLAGFLRKG